LKKYPRKLRERDVRRAFLQRKLGHKYYLRGSGRVGGVPRNENILRKFKYYVEKGLNATINRKKVVSIMLPQKMNLSTHYEMTILHINAIRLLTGGSPGRSLLRLGSVRFEALREISSSSALLLTAELSRWDDSLRSSLIPRTKNWCPEIYERLRSLGFFNLFKKAKHLHKSGYSTSEVKLVEFIKGNNVNKDYKELKIHLHEIIGNTISKWTFLVGGLDEAITNVGHHAYPEGCSVPEQNQNWYLTGGYNSVTRELKIVFYDQGIGIPGSLPESKLWEHILALVKILPVVSREKDAVLLAAAMELDRTSTEETDRGKGLPDMLEFIEQRGAGYLAVMSGHGLYKVTLGGKKREIKKDTLYTPILGTLIIWKVDL
jgi:hypothetical protein